MPEYPPGTPCWIELSSPDLDASVAFYSDLFGWVGQSLAGAGGYRVLSLDGQKVAGLAPLLPDGRAEWRTHLAVVDAGAATTAVVEAGGAVAREPMEVAGAAVTAAFADPAGAGFGVWQPGDVPGAELTDVPGACCWHELATRDTDGARAFYSAVFGWRPVVDGELGYTEWDHAGRLVAGMVSLGDDWPLEVPDHWMVYFAVEDCDAVARRAGELGGRVLQPPGDVPPGRCAVLADPHGAVFSIVALTSGGHPC